MKFIRNVFFRAQNRIDEALSTFSEAVRQIIILSATLIALFWLSVFFYGTFYFYYVPVVAQEKQVYFQFRVCENGVGICTFPSANITFAKDGQLEVFKRGQVYKLILDMDMPESDTNKNLGMFMIDMRLYNRKGEIVQSAAKSGTLQYKSSLLQMLETLAFSPLYLFGYMQQKQHLQIELFSEFTDHPYNPCVGTILQINSLKVEIYTATLKLFAQFSGIRYILYYWPITAAIVGISWNFVLLLFIALLSWYAFRPKPTAGEDSCKQVIKIDLPRKRKPEGSPRKPRQAVTSKAETVGAPADVGDDDDETSLLRAAGDATEESLLRQRQPYSPN